MLWFRLECLEQSQYLFHTLHGTIQTAGPLNNLQKRTQLKGGTLLRLFRPPDEP